MVLEKNMTGEKNMALEKKRSELTLSRPAPGVALITVRGELCLLDQRDELDWLRMATQNAILERRWQFVFDLSNTPSLDSVALGLLVDLLRRVRAEGGGIWIAGPTPFLRRAFDITRLDRLFRLTETVAEALDGCAEEGGRSTE